mgnify:CR=1 FL=1
MTISVNTLTLTLSRQGRGEYMSSLPWREGVRGRGLPQIGRGQVPPLQGGALGGSKDPHYITF